jgi:integrase
MLQRWTGARPGEIVIIRPCDIDQQDKVWLYHPSHFKTDWQANSERVIAIGPEGRQILRSFLNRPSGSFCFSPQESEVWRSKVRRFNRASPLTPSQGARRPKADGKRRPRERYDTCSYRRAIERGVNAANKRRQKDGLELLPNWSPNGTPPRCNGQGESTASGFQRSHAEMAILIMPSQLQFSSRLYGRVREQSP